MAPGRHVLPVESTVLTGTRENALAAVSARCGPFPASVAVAPRWEGTVARGVRPASRERLMHRYRHLTGDT